MKRPPRGISTERRNQIKNSNEVGLGSSRESFVGEQKNQAGRGFFEIRGVGGKINPYDRQRIFWEKNQSPPPPPFSGNLFSEILVFMTEFFFGLVPKIRVVLVLPPDTLGERVSEHGGLLFVFFLENPDWGWGGESFVAMDKGRGRRTLIEN